jgi:hypothetical protein
VLLIAVRKHLLADLSGVVASLNWLLISSWHRYNFKAAATALWGGGVADEGAVRAAARAAALCPAHWAVHSVHARLLASTVR